MKKNNSVLKTLLANRVYRLITAVIIALIVFLVSKNSSSGIVSFMLTWVAFATSYLILAWIIILTYHPQEVRAIANKEDWGGTVVFLFVLLAASISLFAIVFLLRSIPDESKKGFSLHILLSIASVFCSWTLIHTLFTLKYAHKYYAADNSEDIPGQGLDFPGEKYPDFLDFAYFAFVVGMTFQVSDVEITSREIRRLALLHSFLSFIYNTVIVALSINIISGIISK